MASHNPVNHPARPVYRAICGLIGLYLVAFGVIGFVQNAGEEFFAQDDTLVLGQGVNLAGSVLFALLGVVILIATVLGRNIDVAVNGLLSYVVMTISLLMLAILRTDANVLDWSVATVIVTMVIGLTLLTAAKYGTVGTDEDERAWRDGRLVL
ncbi:DUF4383 domain-containing protein [Plantactinospora sp. GCM10030261]|uniref:DUF4383 domain-containing protein n=1 Tax=Plantactinospora sp. GCM10030261 TaxID=3273420 RepID=UPI00361EBFE4